MSDITARVSFLIIWQISYIAKAMQSREIVYDISGLTTGWFLTGTHLDYPHTLFVSSKSVRIYLPVGTWNLWRVEKDTCTNILAFVAKQAMW